MDKRQRMRDEQDGGSHEREQRKAFYLPFINARNCLNVNMFLGGLREERWHT